MDVCFSSAVCPLQIHFLACTLCLRPFPLPRFADLPNHPTRNLGIPRAVFLRSGEAMIQAWAMWISAGRSMSGKSAPHTASRATDARHVFSPFPTTGNDGPAVWTGARGSRGRIGGFEPAPFVGLG